MSFVNAFFDPAEARRLTQTLRKRYSRHGAAFWHGRKDSECSATWPELRKLIQVRENAPPHRAITSRRYPATIAEAVTAEEIAEFIAKGGKVKRLPAGKPSARPWRPRKLPRPGSRGAA